MGYMGSGKSTIGQKISTVLDYNFFDLDDYIVKQEMMSITDLFKKKGEIYFRKKEAQYLNELINSKEDVVLSLGGGTPCYGNNIDIILNTQGVKSYYLQASLKALSNRLSLEKSKRPLISHLKSEEAFIEFLGKHLFERANFYLKADVTIKTDQKTISEITEEIVLSL